jgi:hypothetical protein
MSKLADAIAQDLLAKRPAARVMPTCFACGRSYSKAAPLADDSGSSKFCSVRCRDAFDAAGLPPYDPYQARALMQLPQTKWVVVAGPPGTIGTHPYRRDMRQSGDGFVIVCAGCHKEFVSKGLRCCSAECEHKCREAEANMATMAEVGMEPAASSRRQCEHCGKVLPRWLPGGRGAVRKSQRFCSESCQGKAARKRARQPGRLSGATGHEVRADGAQKPPSNGPSGGGSQSASVTSEPSICTVPINLVGGGSFRFDGPRLDSALLQAILDQEVPRRERPEAAPGMPPEAEPAQDANITEGAPPRSERVEEVPDMLPEPAYNMPGPTGTYDFMPIGATGPTGPVGP